MTDPAHHAITRAYRELAAFASGIIPHDIGGPGFEPEMSDAHELVNDLCLLASKVDAVIEAYGEYARSNGMVSKGDVAECFTEVLHNAIDGNATFLIENGAKDLIRAREDDEADRADHEYKRLKAEAVL